MTNASTQYYEITEKTFETIAGEAIGSGPWGVTYTVEGLTLAALGHETTEAYVIEELDKVPTRYLLVVQTD